MRTKQATTPQELLYEFEIEEDFIFEVNFSAVVLTVTTFAILFLPKLAWAIF